jgi:hypothetical protein
MRNVEILRDDDAVEARRFGVFTSGQSLLYAPDGALLFSGGITASRGHAGDNAGIAAIAALARGRGAATTETPVFGCALRSEEASDAVF